VKHWWNSEILAFPLDWSEVSCTALAIWYLSWFSLQLRVCRLTWRPVSKTLMDEHSALNHLSLDQWHDFDQERLLLIRRIQPFQQWIWTYESPNQLEDLIVVNDPELKTWRENKILSSENTSKLRFNFAKWRNKLIENVDTWKNLQEVCGLGCATKVKKNIQEWKPVEQARWVEVFHWSFCCILSRNETCHVWDQSNLHHQAVNSKIESIS
jgi:hypothetical protein